jgi:hypothetical protein
MEKRNKKRERKIQGESQKVDIHKLDICLHAAQRKKKQMKKEIWNVLKATRDAYRALKRAQQLTINSQMSVYEDLLE